MKMRPNSALTLLALLLSLGVTPHALAADSVNQLQSLVGQGQHSQALAMADRLLAANTKDPQTRFLKGIALTELNRTAEATAVFQKLTEDFPELPEPYNNLAVLYAQQRQYDKARSALEMAIRTHPSYATAHENLGDVYARLASQAYDKALQLDSANPGAQSKLAMIREITSGKGAGGARPAGAEVAAKPLPVAPAQIAAAPATPLPAPAPAASAPTPPAAASTKPAEATPAAAPAPGAKPPQPAVAETTKAAENKVAEAPVAPAPGKDEQAAITTVQEWAKSWSNKDVKAYLAFYDKEFQTPRGMSRASWEAQRKERVGKPGNIRVSIETPEAKIEGDVATVRFRQHYDSAGFDSSTTKTLELVKRNGQWKIREERVGG